ncbi:hypothetical protein D3P08_00230 [Paenibacillus nanensis]|uniref:Uncharacterized protein n=1 Tax=Paenibacillus nanensis TaxID=393251 RepID=A0A3A1VHU7_9BACL|nr:hypothetical protein [Paenibacillus nanensis]RIX60057.1 hypothetical protein D3P08_00230 [Paenibacillus nanensis]
MGIEYMDLYNKSKLFINKGITKRNESDMSEFLLWASLSLELLGKATLAFIHPSLVVDPNDPKGLLVACGYKNHDDFKTIQAKTVFERLHVNLSIPKFDHKKKDFCMSLANKRNAELHSGLLPFDGLRLDLILPHFWEICVILLQFQGKNLDEWIGSDEAIRALKIITDHSATLKTIVESRVDACRNNYREKYKFDQPHIIYDVDDNKELIPCPACNNVALAYGEFNDKVCEGESEDNPWHAVYTYYYDTTEVHCRYCDLKLIGYEEVEIVIKDIVFTKTTEEEPDYDYDYGND